VLAPAYAIIAATVSIYPITNETEQQS